MAGTAWIAAWVAFTGAVLCLLVAEVLAWRKGTTARTMSWYGLARRLAYATIALGALYWVLTLIRRP